jgi:hypothetical protein
VHAREIHAHEVNAHEVHTCEMHAYEARACEMHIYEVHTHEMHACEVHAHEMHDHEMHDHEMHAREMHVYEVHTLEMHAYEVHAHEVHTYEGFCEDLARQTIVTHLSQLRLGFRRCRILVYVVTYGFQSPLWRPKGQYLGRCTVCLGISAHRPCFDLSVYHLIANPIACASFPRLTHLL